MPEQRKREIAYKVRINDILKGEYVRRDGWDPNFIMINNKQVSRVNIMGVVVSIPDTGQNNLTIDDGSGRIEVRSFDSPEMLASLLLVILFSWLAGRGNIMARVILLLRF